MCQELVPSPGLLSLFKSLDFEDGSLDALRELKRPAEVVLQAPAVQGVQEQQLPVRHLIEKVFIGRPPGVRGRTGGRRRRPRWPVKVYFRHPICNCVNCVSGEQPPSRHLGLAAEQRPINSRLCLLQGTLALALQAEIVHFGFALNAQGGAAALAPHLAAVLDGVEGCVKNRDQL